MAIVLFGGEIQNVVTVTIFVNFHPYSKLLIRDNVHFG